MTVSPYTRNYGNVNEQSLLEDLVIESVQLHGIDCYYLPRTNANLDTVFEEATRVSFNTAVPLEMYLVSAEGFQGDGSFMSQLGVEIRDQVTFSMSQRRFGQETTKAAVPLVRPREADLIWYPFNQKLFEIKYVNKFEMHYPLGALQTWEVKCELFEFADQAFATGIPAIDSIPTNITMDLELSIVHDANGRPVLDANGNMTYITSNTGNRDPLDDSIEIHKESEEVQDWSERDPYTEKTHF